MNIFVPLSERFETVFGPFQNISPLVSKPFGAVFCGLFGVVVIAIIVFAVVVVAVVIIFPLPLSVEFGEIQIGTHICTRRQKKQVFGSNPDLPPAEQTKPLAAFLGGGGAQSD